MNSSKNKLGLLRVPRVRVSADGVGVVSHAGVGLLREVAALSGLSAGVSEVLADTYKGRWSHDPGVGFTDLAAAVADGADCVSGIGQLVDQQTQHGPVASVTTAWRLLDHRVDAAHLAGIKSARAAARAKAWAAGAGPAAGSTLTIDIDATITIDHSDNKENAAATWKHTTAITRCWRFWTGRTFPPARPWPRCCGPVTPVPTPPPTTRWCWPTRWPRCRRRFDPAPSGRIGRRPSTAPGHRRCWRTDSAGATQDFAKACRAAGVGFSFGFAVTEPVKAAVTTTLGEAAVTAHFDGINTWAETITTDGTLRDNGWIAEATALVDLTAWSAGTRLILHKERPHPGAQLRFTDVDGHRITAFITDTPTGVVPGQLAGLELRHRQHARVQDRIRQAKDTGLRNLPCHHFAANAAWLETVMAATDLIAWTKLIGFADQPELARCEINAFRYRVLHIAARITRGARQFRLRLDASWRWAESIAQAWTRIGTAFT